MSEREENAIAGSDNPSKPDDTSQTSLDRYEKIVDRAHKEIEGVRSVYKWLISILGIVIFVGTTLAVFLIGKSIADLQSYLETRVEAHADRAEARLETRVEALADRVEARIDDQFRDKNIQDLVEKKAKERIDEVADPMIAKRITEAVNPKLLKLQETMTAMDSLQKQLNADVLTTKENLKKIESIALSEFRSTSDFIMTIVAAQNDDRPAFDKLESFSKDKSYRFSKEAGRAWWKILDEHYQTSYRSGFPIPWKEGIDPSKLGLAQIRKNYEYFEKANSPHIRRSLVDYAWNRNDIPKKERMQFMVDVMRSDSSLMVVEYAGRYFNEASGQRKKPLAVSYFLQWWKQNKDKIEIEGDANQIS